MLTRINTENYESLQNFSPPLSLILGKIILSAEESSLNGNTLFGNSNVYSYPGTRAVPPIRDTQRPSTRRVRADRGAAWRRRPMTRGYSIVQSSSVPATCFRKYLRDLNSKLGSGESPGPRPKLNPGNRPANAASASDARGDSAHTFTVASLLSRCTVNRLLPPSLDSRLLTSATRYRARKSKDTLIIVFIVIDRAGHAFGVGALPRPGT